MSGNLIRVDQIVVRFSANQTKVKSADTFLYGLFDMKPGAATLGPQGIDPTPPKGVTLRDDNTGAILESWLGPFCTYNLEGILNVTAS